METTVPGLVLLAFASSNGNGKGSQFSPEIKAQLDAIRTTGYLIGSGTLGEGITTIAAPLFGNGGKLHGAVCLVGPEFRMSAETIQNELLPQVLETSSIISSKLGWYTPHLPRTPA